MGCPLATAAFTLALHTALAQTKDHMTQVDSNAVITAYVDDTNILTRPEHITTAAHALKGNLMQLGLRLNETKHNVG